MVKLSHALFAASALVVVACSSPAAQSAQNVEALRKEVEALKASQAEMQKSLDEIRTFLKEATGGRFGAPSIENTAFDVKGAPARGSDTAPVTIVEISDYHCPYCKRHVQQTQPQIYSAYVDTGKARHVFVHFPIEQLHPDAYRSHEAASCAADQGKFWELHAKLFETPAKTTEQLTALAQSAGLDAGALGQCLESGKYRQAVRASVERIAGLGVNGTPMFLIGRTPSGSEPMKVLKTVQGAHPFQTFKTVIDGILNEQPR